MKGFLAPLIASACLLGCDTKSAVPDAADKPEQAALRTQKLPTSGEPVPAGDLRAQQAVIRFALYSMPGAKSGLLAAAKEVRAREFAHLKLARSDGSNVAPSVLLVEPPMTDFAPPGVERLKVFGRGLTQRQAEAVQHSTGALVLAFGGTKDQLPKLHADALRMTAAVAAQTGALIWDEDTGQLFSFEAWAGRTASDLKEPSALGQHFAIRSQREGPLVRLVTFGMAKFGLPDICAAKVPVAAAAAMGTLLNLVAATLVADPNLHDDGELVIDVAKLGASLPAGAPSRIEVSVAHVERKEGDPDNRVIAIVFPGPPESLHERQSAVLAKISGANDEVKTSPVDPEVVAASQRAQKALARLQSAFNKGLTKHETLLVKAPFQTRDRGQEWMWVEVLAWKGTKISGLLQNDPKYVDGIEAGSKVEIPQALVFDYIHKQADGSVVGNETAKLMRRKQAERMRGWEVGMDPGPKPNKLGEQP